MLIICPSCATSYDVGLASLGRGGRPVRCLRCRTVWHAQPSRADELIAAADALGPTRPAETGRPTTVAADAVADLPDWGLEVAATGEAEPPDVEAETEPAGEAFLAPEDNAESALTAADAAAENELAATLEMEAPPIAPIDLDEGRPPIDVEADYGPASETPADVETAAARRYRHNSRRRSWHWPLSGLQNGILALVIVDAIVVGWRSDFVRAMPQTASFFALVGMPVNLRGLTFEGLATSTERHEGVPILVVEGNIVNTARKDVDVPRLKFSVRNNARQEIYSWTAVPSRPLLPPGEAVGFHTRLASPPPDARDVLVRFVNRRDVLAGTH